MTVPPDLPDPINCWDPAAPGFMAGSRNGWFHAKCRDLLDEIAGHEALRFLAAQTWTRESRENGSRTSWTVLDQAAIGRAAAELDDLLERCEREVEIVSERLFFAQDGWSPGEVREALSSALSRGLSSEVTDGGEGDSPAFLFAVLVNVRELLRLARARPLTVVYYNWLPL
jgi:hypothetical protein